MTLTKKQISYLLTSMFDSKHDVYVTFGTAKTSWIKEQKIDIEPDDDYGIKDLKMNGKKIGTLDYDARRAEWDKIKKMN